MLDRLLLVRVYTVLVAVGGHNLRDLLFARQEPQVVRGVAAQVDPRPHRGRPREDVDVPREMSLRVDDVHAAVAEVVVGSGKGSYGHVELFVGQEA